VTSPPTGTGLRRTPLHHVHVELGGRMVPFAGWDMPVQYVGVIAEHQAVRTAAGVFDVSHMGQLAVEGPDAARELQRLLSNDIRRMDADGMAQYTLLTNEQGGIEDDLIAYRLAPERYLLVVNASNVEHDAAWLRERLAGDVVLEDQSEEWAMLALQGPIALDVLEERCGVRLHELAPFRFVETTFTNLPLIAATTGYTGERGCELLVPLAGIEALWEALTNDERVAPAGLGARDTLRLEVCYPLHGNDISATTTAVEAGLGWACGWDTEFTGHDALRRAKEAGAERRLVALRATERGIPRQGCAVLAGDEVVGEVTSGTMSPTLGTGIALAYVSSAHATAGTSLEVDVRGRRYPVEVAARPLYRPPTATPG
jgi:aminomethyltransferase